MKKQLIFTALGAMLLASCADTYDRVYEGGNPQKEGYEYLADYAPLKEYVDHSKYTDFRVGIATLAGDYTKQQLVYALVNSNADETVAGNAMKMGSCVNDKGEMSFDNVTSFVNAVTDAGLSVYGHTLAWHSQQPVKYLNGLLKDKELDVDPDAMEEKLMTSKTYTDGPFPFYPMGVTPDVINGCLHYVPDGNWNQFFIFPGGENKLVEGNYLIRLYMTADKEASGVQLTIQNGWGGDAQNITISIPVEEGKQIYELQCPGITAAGSDAYDCILKPQTADVTLDVEKIEFYKLESPAVEFFVDQVTNGEMEQGKPMDNFVVREPGKGDVPGNPIAGGPEGKNYIKISSPEDPGDSWNTHFFIYTPDKAWAGGERYKISFWYKASEDAGSETQCHGTPGGYKHWQMLPNNPSFTTEWQYYEATSTIPAEGDGMLSIAFNLNVNKGAVDYYFADIHWYTIEKGNKIPLTPEEKHDTLVWAMDKWIGGMMEACDGKVKAWDVVNEAISGGDADAEGVYALQHDNGSGDFFWQDYMGDLDYVRTAVASARKHFEANGGNASELKLFVNDYNLEYEWHGKDNKKLQSLIKWIERWEADGVTKIDGIGSQMHISCYADADEQNKRKELITNSFERMAATGKLVRVSELDMGYVDANGKTLTTAELSEEQHKEMAALYKFVVSEYLRIIPVAQQWGICQWCITDSPADSGWRKNEPVGLWDKDYYRKHTYAGFADGLSGK